MISQESPLWLEGGASYGWPKGCVQAFVAPLVLRETTHGLRFRQGQEMTSDSHLEGT